MTVQALPDEDGVRVLRAEGELDVLSAVPALDDVTSLVQGARGVVLDLSRVTFFDSSAVRLVDRLARAAARAGAAYRVVAPSGSPARRVLEVVGMAGLLADEDLATALAAVRRG